MIIKKKEQFLRFLERAQQGSLLAVDTEFISEKSYWPRLCLLQLGTEDEFVCVDPFQVTDLSPLRSIMTNPGIIKIFHACGEDMIILQHILGVTPAPVFDTQVAATLLGYSNQTGYGSLVKGECGVTLRKADSFTDWSIRPLTDSQIDYALDDVRYLPRIYHQMIHNLEKRGRLDWITPDMEDLSRPQRYYRDPQTQYLRLKRRNSLSPRQLCIARSLAAWREEFAQKRDLPRRWVLTDDQIIDMCKRRPAKTEELFAVRGASKGVVQRNANTILQLITDAWNEPKENWPEIQHHEHHEDFSPQLAMMNALVQLRSQENDIASSTLASRKDMELLTAALCSREAVNSSAAADPDQFPDCGVLKGWRRKIVGNDLLALLRGELCLSIENGRMNVSGKEQ